MNRKLAVVLAWLCDTAFGCSAATAVPGRLDSLPSVYKIRLIAPLSSYWNSLRLIGT
jgi:hypothetical protein